MITVSLKPPSDLLIRALVEKDSMGEFVRNLQMSIKWQASPIILPPPFFGSWTQLCDGMNPALQV